MSAKREQQEDKLGGRWIEPQRLRRYAGGGARAPSEKGPVDLKLHPYLCQPNLPTEP